MRMPFDLNDFNTNNSASEFIEWQRRADELEFEIEFEADTGIDCDSDSTVAQASQENETDADVEVDIDADIEANEDEIRTNWRRVDVYDCRTYEQEAPRCSKCYQTPVDTQPITIVSRALTIMVPLELYANLYGDSDVPFMVEQDILHHILSPQVILVQDPTGTEEQNQEEANEEYFTAEDELDD